VERGEISRRDLLTGRFKRAKTEDDPFEPKEDNYIFQEVQVCSLGIAHGLETLESDEGLLRERISVADAAILETLPFEYSRTEVGLLLDTESWRFWDRVAEIAKDEEKSVIGIDSQCSGLIAGNKAFRFIPRMGGGVLTGFVVSEGLHQGKIDRRKLIGMGAAILVDSYFGFNGNKRMQTLRAVVQGQRRFYETLMTYGLDDQLVLDMSNYRNIRAGRNLDRLCQLAPRELGVKSIAMIYGRAHQDVIKEYALNEHMMERKLKDIPYFIPDLFAEDSFRVYDYDGTVEDWVKREGIE